MTTPIDHEARFAALARERADAVRRRAQGRHPAWPRPLRRAGATLARAWRQLRAGVQQHWDVGVFDLVFGAVKAFLVYPALFVMGLAWTIPLAEYAPLNTQLWTAGYLVLRRRIASACGRLRFGRSLAQLDRVRIELAGPDAPGVHHALDTEAGVRVVRIERSGWKRMAKRLRGEMAPDTDVTTRELRRWIADPELLLAAETLRHNAFLYERVLMNLLLGRPAGDAGRRALERRMDGQPQVSQLARIVAPESEARDAVILDDADRIGEAVGMGSRERLGLRWLHGSYRRAIRRETARLERARYGLLSRIADRPGETRDDALEARKRVHAWARQQRDRWVEQSRAYAARVCHLRDDDHARELLAREVAVARGLGLRARRAGAVARRVEGNGAAETPAAAAPFATER